MDKFLGSSVFNLSEEQLDRVVALVYAFDSNYTPIMGQQLTLSADSNQQQLDRLNLFVSRAQVVEPQQECDPFGLGCYGRHDNSLRL